jgi:predicted membrane protein
MKNKKIIILLTIALFAAAWANAQEFKLAKNSGRLEIRLGKVTVEGHTGNEIIFSTRNGRSDKDERAQGLRSVNSLGLEDNTGLGINVTDKGNVIEVSQLKKTNSPDIKILVPKRVIVSFSHDSQYGGTARFKDLENEIEISAQYNSVELENVTGPLTVKSIYGHVEATFGSVIKDPISIVSVYGYVDVTLPQATKANLKLSTSYGEILVANEFKIEVEPSRSGLREYSDKVTGTINGGGVNIDLSCNYGKVYLRKK